jgi:hypothetical protein
VFSLDFRVLVSHRIVQDPEIDSGEILDLSLTSEGGLFLAFSVTRCYSRAFLHLETVSDKLGSTMDSRLIAYEICALLLAVFFPFPDQLPTFRDAFVILEVPSFLNNVECLDHTDFHVTMMQEYRFGP